MNTGSFMLDHSTQNGNPGKVLLAADTNAKENPLQATIQFLKVIRKRWIILACSFALVFSVFVLKQITSRGKYNSSAELIAIAEQYTSSEVLNHPLLKLGAELMVSDEVIDGAASRVTLKKADGVTEIDEEDKTLFLRSNLVVFATRSKPHVIQLTFADYSEEQAEQCLNAVIDSYQEFSRKRMEEWKVGQLKVQQDKIKFYDESDKEIALGNKLINQSEEMTNSLNVLKEKFDPENPEHRQQLSQSLQEQALGFRPDSSKRDRHSESYHETESDVAGTENNKNRDKKDELVAKNDPLKETKQNIKDNSDKKNLTGNSRENKGPGIQKIPDPDSDETLLTERTRQPMPEYSIHQIPKTMDEFEKELAQMQLFLFQSRILNQLRSTVVRVEQKEKNRNILAAELEIPIHVKINRNTETRPMIQSNSKFRMFLVVCFLSMGLGIGLIFVVDQFDDHFRSPVEAENILVKPVMGVIPAKQEDGKGQNYSYLRKEAFFVTKIFMENHGIGKGIIGITSGTKSENSSDTSYDLAKIYAQYNVKTLLIDANFRNGQLTETLKHTFGIGLSDLLQQPEVSQEAIKRLVCTTDEDNLFFISQGTKSSTPLLLFDQKRLQAILNWAEENYDLVILDLPSATDFNDSKVIGRYCKQILFTVSPELTTKQVTKRALVSLESFGCNVAGIIFIDRGNSPVWDSSETSDSPLFNINHIMISNIKNQNPVPGIEEEKKKEKEDSVRAA